MNDETFLARPDWYETRILPAIRRRTAIGIAVLLLLLAWWLTLHSWIPVVLAAVVVCDRLFELLSISSTKEAIAFFRATTTKDGLIIEAGLDRWRYPWESLEATFIEDKNGIVTEIAVINRTKKWSRLELVSLENLTRLAAIIREQTKAN
jgi:hypothetical protein